jgi:5-methylcytosine-specific restriction endonuclease McrA
LLQINELTEEVLLELVPRVRSKSHLLKILGYCDGGTNIKKITVTLQRFGIDYSHFVSSIGDYSRKNNALRRQLIYERYIERWKRGLETGYKNQVRRYLFEKYDSKCMVCKWGETNLFTKKTPLQIHHIDGNAQNCKEENLMLLCPNCHALTNNYGSRNKASVRTHR